MWPACFPKFLFAGVFITFASFGCLDSRADVNAASTSALPSAAVSATWTQVLTRASTVLASGADVVTSDAFATAVCRLAN